MYVFIETSTNVLWHVAYEVVEAILTLIFFFFFPLSSKIIQSLSFKLRVSTVVITSGPPSWPYKQHDVLINCTPHPCETPASMLCSIAVMSHPLGDSVTLPYAVAAVNPEELFGAVLRGRKHDTLYYFNYKLNVISLNDSVRDPICRNFQR